MSMIEPATYSSAAVMLQSYPQIRKRLRQEPPPPRYGTKQAMPEPRQEPGLPWFTPRCDPVLVISEAAFGQMLAQAGMNRPQPLKQIMHEVATKHGVTVNDITCAGRNTRLCAARFEFYYRAAIETEKSLPEIGLRCGNRDHTTIMHGIKMHCDRNGLPYPRRAKWTDRSKKR